MTLKKYSKRWFLLAFAMMMTFLSGWLWFFTGRMMIMFWWWGLMPLSSVLALGSVRNRVVNGLPLFVVWLYGLISLLTRDFTTYLWLFTLTPYVSLVLKPRRHRLKYVTLFLSTTLLLYGLITGDTVSTFLRVGGVVVINVVFFPPILWRKIKTFVQQKTRS